MKGFYSALTMGIFVWLLLHQPSPKATPESADPLAPFTGMVQAMSTDLLTAAVLAGVVMILLLTIRSLFR